MKHVVHFMLLGTIMTGLSLVAFGQITKGKSRPLTTKQLMSGLVKPNCAGIGETLKEPPKDDAGWAALATKAALLNEASYLLMDDGRCPDGAWADAAKALREGSVAVIAKIEAKDAEGAKTEFQTLTKACGACHTAHKK